MRALATTAVWLSLGMMASASAGTAELRANSGERCAAAIRAAHGRTDLPASCRSLGGLRLGDAEGAARKVFGEPDATTANAATGVRTVAWIFPRNLNRRLAAQPVAPNALSYGVLYVNSRHGRIVAVRDETGGLAPGLTFAGVKPGASVDRADRALGAPSSVSRARDYRSYAPLPLAIHADEDRQTVAGFELGDNQKDISGPEAQGNSLKNKDGRIDRLTLVFNNKAEG